MLPLNSPPPVPVHPLTPDEATGSQLVTLVRSEGTLAYDTNLLLPHRKAHYMLLFVRQSRGRHWLDMVPYAHQVNTLYFSAPNQVIIKEEPTPFWSTYLGFTS